MILQFSLFFQGTTETSKKQKLFLMSWCPDTARIKKKMLYSSSFDALKKALVGVHKYIQVKITSIIIQY
jgi:cofilin